MELETDMRAGVLVVVNLEISERLLTVEVLLVVMELQIQVEEVVVVKPQLLQLLVEQEVLELSLFVDLLRS